MKELRFELEGIREAAQEFLANMGDDRIFFF